MIEEGHVTIELEWPGFSKAYRVPIDACVTVLDALCYIQETIDSSLVFRWNCRSGQCGLCAVRINGTPRLACLERIQRGRQYDVSPIDVQRHVEGLICDVSDVYRGYFARSHLGETELQRKEAFEQLLVKEFADQSGKPGPAVNPIARSDDAARLQKTCIRRLADLRTCLRGITQTPALWACFQDNEPCLPDADSTLTEVAQSLGLIGQDGRTAYRVTRVRELTFLTDGPWRIRNGGVFPWSDESELMLNYIEERGLDSATDGIVDVSCGCGHSVLAYWGRGPRFAFDVNLRAESFLKLNAAVNEQRVTYRTADVTLGLPFDLLPRLGRDRLFVGNLPHA